MKKLFLSLVAAVVAATATFAQSTIVATLTHGETVTMFYGVYALRDAHNTAVSGDIINLSGGVFLSTNITKAVTLRGAGIDAQNPTFILNNFGINIPTTDTGRLSMEGIRCSNIIDLDGTLTNAYFLKCLFSEIKINNTNANVKNAMFVDCKVTNSFHIYYGNNSLQFINCFVRDFEVTNRNGNNSGASLINCILNPVSANPSNIHNSQLLNCVIYRWPTNAGGASSILPNSSVATNCVAIDYSKLFDGSPANTGCKTANYEEIFRTFKGSYSDTETFELTDEAKTTFLGTDDTEIGMYGGVFPYDPIPSYPQITKMNVANRTTNDGKLSVEIEVSDAK